MKAKKFFKFKIFFKLILVLVFMLADLPVGYSEYPLKPLDTSSPRATLLGFLELTDEIGHLGKQYLAVPSKDNFISMAYSFFKGRYFLNLSEVPESAKVDIGNDSVVMLWDILNRIELPPAAEIPDAVSMEAKIAQGKPARWVIPHTEITIEMVTTNNRKGEYLFSPKTVERINEFYYRTSHIPYQRNITIDNPWRLMMLWGGWYFPPQTIENLPEWLKINLADQLLWKWLMMIILITAVSGLIWSIYHWSGKFFYLSQLGKYARHFITPLAIVFLVRFISYMAEYQIITTGYFNVLLRLIIPIVNFSTFAWVVWHGSLFIAEIIILLPKIANNNLNVHLLRLMSRIFAVIGVMFVLLLGANRIGIPLYGLIAGASVGGLAIALASQSTLENFLGSINLFIDQPVRVGDLCKYAGEIGTVEEIGIRSTRLRGKDRTVTTIPNSDFSKMKITNLTLRDRMLIRTTLEISADTNPDQVRNLLTQLQTLLIEHPRVIKDSMYVRLIGFGNFAIKIEIYAYINTAKNREFLEIRESIFIRVIDILNIIGVNFAHSAATESLSKINVTE